MRVWVDLTNTAHVVVLRPLVELLEARGHDVEITVRPLSHPAELLAARGHPAPGPGARGLEARGPSGGTTVRPRSHTVERLGDWGHPYTAFGAHGGVRRAD